MKKIILVLILGAFVGSAFVGSAFAAEKKSRYSLAIEKYNMPITLSFDSMVAYNEKNYKKSEKLILEAMKTGYNDAFVYRHLADIYRNTDRVSQAIENYEKYLSLSEDETGRMMAKINLAYAYTEKRSVTKEDFDKATAIVNGEITVKRKNPELLENEILRYAHTRIYASYGSFLGKDAETELENMKAAEMYLTGLKARPELEQQIKNVTVAFPNMEAYAINTAYYLVNAYNAASKINMDYLDQALAILEKPLFKKTKNKNIKKSIKVIKSIKKNALDRMKKANKDKAA